MLAVAPSYIEKYGEPKEPEDILKTPVFFFYLPTGGEGTTLTFTKNGETRDVRIDPSLRSSAYLPLVPSALGGEGVLANINSLMVDNYLKTSDLKLILTDWKLPAVPIYQEVNPARERDPLISQFIEEVLTHVHGIIKDIPGFMGYEEARAVFSENSPIGHKKRRTSMFSSFFSGNFSSEEKIGQEIAKKDPLGVGRNRYAYTIRNQCG